MTGDYEYEDENSEKENQENIIDEIINSLEEERIDENDLKDELTKNERKNIISEYEIVMNCDDSDYIVYYKKNNKEKKYM